MNYEKHIRQDLNILENCFDRQRTVLRYVGMFGKIDNRSSYGEFESFDLATLASEGKEQSEIYVLYRKKWLLFSSYGGMKK